MMRNKGKTHKTRMVRLISVLLALLTLMLVACTKSGTNDGEESGTRQPEQTQPPAPGTDNLILAQDGESDFRIVTPLGASEALQNAALQIRTRFEAVADVRIPMASDSEPAAECEILVGEVSRMERMEVYSEQGLSESDFAIVVKGSKIVILGGSETSTIAAVDYFLATSLAIDEDEKQIGILPDYIHASRAEGDGNMTVTEVNESYVYFTINAGSGSEVFCRLNYAGNHGWRLLANASSQTEFDETGASQQLSEFLGEEPVQTVESITWEQTEGGLILRAGDGSRVELTCEPFLMECYSPSGKLAATVTDVRASQTGSGITGRLEQGEAIFGTGERFDTANQRGKRLELYALDQWNVIGGNGYMPIPVFASSRGSGIFVNRYEPMTADLGARDSDLWQIDVQKAGMDCYIFASDLISDVLYGYSLLSGFADMPEDWTFGVLVCRYSPDFSTKEGIYAMIDKMEEYDLPWTGVIIEGWSIYEEQYYDDLKEVVDYVHSLGKKVLAYCVMGTVYTQYLTLPNEDYLVHIASNGSTRIPTVSSDIQNPDASSSNTRLYLDLTNPAACEWFFGEVWGRLIYDIGIDGAKIDFCELFPESIELDFYDGETSGAHHWYPTYFNSLFYKLLSEKEDGGMNFSRGGGIGSQRNPFMWAGDQTREFTRLEAALSAVLSSGLSGVPFMTYDMAGYRPSSQSGVKDDEATVFIRGTQMTAFTACIQTHGNVTRPYDFDEQTVDIYRAYTKLHELLVPYIREYAEIACETGMPLVRHLVLAYQNDTNVYNIDDEFLFGDGLLVAPVLDDSTSRDVYLPEGRWKNLFTGEVYEVGAEGRTLTDVQVPIEQIPVYINLDHTSATLDDLLVQAEEILETLR